MSGLTKPLLWLAVSMALLGVAAHLLWSGLGPPREAWASLPQGFMAAFDGSWSWMLWGASVTSGLAVVLTGVELLLGLRRARAAPEFEQLQGDSLREDLIEIARRVHACVESGADADVIAAFDELVRGAVRLTASDIHITPKLDGLLLTYRVHGALHEVVRLDQSVTPALTTRVKVLARLDTYVRGTPQDGRLVMDIEGGSIEARVSTLPTENGERVVLRLVRGSQTAPDLASLGFSPEVDAQLKAVLARPQGMFLVTGPVGSGKTTTLYAAMKHIAATRAATTTIVSLEDPIELELPFATQTQMHPKAGMTFASVLRSVLRQDPNVLMVGEIRDKETASVATQAGLTGHLILTTVHGESAAGTFARLLDMDIEPYALASAAVGALSQRLVRTLCTACRKETPVAENVMAAFQEAGVIISPGTYYEPVGCTFCEGSGFTGRTPIAELLPLGDKLREAISERKATNEIHALAQAEGMVSLMRQGFVLAARGDTSLEEVLRVTR